ncbi:hypothetical protein [Corynebacterium epidermidicanis]|uniref:Uncharacterized protein n=1 Tax=Corynebacterium epidermidicanis TaxID=1050174 RepID=A0A0G3GVU3_9CORY|nr:hypothetical protein [Corynebacterium epidermidicanis]AKK03623.1 hypothetical protein CEPID_08885 [Corynebacterium epidermidicanis]
MATIWTWTGNELRDELGGLIAQVRSDVIHTNGERLLIESTPGTMVFRARATSSDGRVFTVHQRGMTVGRLVAQCGSAAYDLPRLSLWRKERMIYGAQGPMARIRPLISGKVQVVGEQYAEELPDLDAVFLSWACVLVDSPVRRPKF